MHRVESFVHMNVISQVWENMNVFRKGFNANYDSLLIKMIVNLCLA